MILKMPIPTDKSPQVTVSDSFHITHSGFSDLATANLNVQKCINRAGHDEPKKTREEGVQH